MCLKYFVDVGAMAVRRVLKRDLKRIAKATGGQLTTLAFVYTYKLSRSSPSVFEIQRSFILRLNFNERCSLQPLCARLCLTWRERRRLRRPCWVRLRRLCRTECVTTSSSSSRSESILLFPQQTCRIEFMPDHLILKMTI